MDKKEPFSGPEFVSGVIVKISSLQPLPSKKCIKVQCRDQNISQIKLIYTVL